MGNSSGNLSSVDKAIKVCDLFGVSKRNMSWLVEFKEIIEIFVSGSKYFSLIDILSVDRHLVLGNNCHLLRIHLVSIDEISEESSI